MKYGLIGHPLSHSYSKIIHEKIASYQYSINDILPEALPAFFEKKDFEAINVTIPYKESVIPYLDQISPEAKEIGAVNTIINKNGKLYGYNTDYLGLTALIKKAQIDISNKKVLILGSGGTSKTAYYTAKKMGARQILKVSRSPKEDAITYEMAIKNHTDAEIIINTSPCGMYPNTDEKPIDIINFPKLKGIIDVIYNPLSSLLIIEGRENNIPSIGGLYMLVAQAVYACSLFIDKELQLEIIDQIYDSIYEEKSNIVLIGMPSCGKSTIGKKIAEISVKEFIDCDQKIIEKINMPISKFFEEKGESAFREIESRLISELALVNKALIATGGGAILKKANIQNLKKNGIIFFINRDLEKLLVSDDRPLSSSKEAIQKLYEERFALYRQAADYEINGNLSIEEISLQIINILKENRFHIKKGASQS